MRRCDGMADIQDLKSWARKKACGFKSHHRHHVWFDPPRNSFVALAGRWGGSASIPSVSFSALARRLLPVAHCARVRAEGEGCER